MVTTNGLELHVMPALQRPLRDESAEDGTCQATAVSVRHKSSVHLTSIGWSARGELHYDDWCRLGARLGVAGRSSGWWIGDWLSYGVAKYGRRHAVATRLTGYDSQTLTNLVYVARRFEVSRRRETLSWSHHAELAPLDIDEQEFWLDRAASKRLSVRAMGVERSMFKEATIVGHPSRPATALQKDDRGTDSTPRVLTCPHCGSAVAIP
jgi:hypothetical protein